MEGTLSITELRQLIHSNKWTVPTTGTAAGHVQANLVMIPKEAAFHFLLFCTRNPKPCPVLDVLEPGHVEPAIAPGADLRKDLPKYRIYRNGVLDAEVQDVVDFFSEDMVSFLLGCSFSFETAMLANRLPVRNIEERKNVSMYITNRTCREAGPFSAPLVVSMRPLEPSQAVRAVQITTRFHMAHGAPVYLGDFRALGIKELAKPDFGDAVTIRPGEIPVFWACGVTAILAAVSAKLPLVITHSPGHMFVSDLKDEDLTVL